ncbi:hypothetical protein MHAEM_21136 [Mycolicibacterium phlei]|nr:hypothetical protein [Mycolicibacterium phlei]
MERVAEAMWVATSNTDPAWHEIPAVIMNGYRDMARAAIEALQLTEEHDTEAYFEAVPDSPYPGHERFAGHRKITRLVGPWRAAE